MGWPLVSRLYVDAYRLMEAVDDTTEGDWLVGWLVGVYRFLFQ